MTTTSPAAAIQSLILADECTHVYGEGHARTEEARARAAGDLARAAAAHAITLSAIRTGLIINRIIVSDAWAAASPFASRLTRGGTAAVMIARGANEADALWLLDHGDDDAWLVSPSGHIRRNPLARSGGTPALSAASDANAPAATIVGDEGAEQLQATWTSLLVGERRVDDRVSTLAARIGAAVRSNGSGLVPLMDLKSHDEYTYVHAINVGLLASALAQATGLDGDVLHEVTEAALLHDVGKRLTPLPLLGKPGKLSDAERAVMQEHPSSGAALLAGVRGVSDLAIVAAYEHHMRIDGTGYPNGARSRAPSLCSQLIQIADIFDALRSDRPYRKGLSSERCLEILGEGSGAAFDKDLFEVFRTRVVRRIARAADAA
ncbi:MAG: HD domain-containing phosphohydrolase [Planctomycetota bacterium]